MALPIVKTVADCTDYTRTVAPYISQLGTLLYEVFDALKTNPASLTQIYLDTNPLLTSVALSLLLSPIFLIVSEITRNYSQVDRFWSILPTIYNVHYAIWAYLHGLPTQRLVSVMAVSIMWSTRLTFNYWRKGGYQVGSEDYRWEIVRSHVNKLLFFLLNVTFISTAQNLLLVSVTTPTYVLLLSSRLSSISPQAMPAYDLVDAGMTALMCGIIIFIFMADQQQWDYQTTKYQYRETAKFNPSTASSIFSPTFTRQDLDLGFLTRGLFSYSRHPNFAGEQSFWISLYVWSCLRTSTPYHWAAVGAFHYIVLFQASTAFQEYITRGKYLEYNEYRRRVGKFLPLTWRAARTEELIGTGTNGAGTGKRTGKGKANANFADEVKKTR